jgi:type I restriction enzyme S subunit
MSWEMVKFGKVLEIKNGRDHKKVNTPNGIYPIYGSGGIMGYANEYLCNENATIIGRKGSINNPIFVTKKFWNIDTAFALCSSPSIDPKFLFYFCLTYNFEKHNKATTLPSLTKKDLLEIEIPLPPLSTQQRIAEILDKADALRRKDQALLKKYDDLAQAIFIDMFGDPVKNEIGWEVKRLGDSIKKVQIGPFGTQLHESDYVLDGIPVINPMHIGDLKIKPNYKYSISKEKYNELDQYHLSVGDVILARRGEMGRCAIVGEKEKGFLCGTGSLFISVDKNKLEPLFLVYVLSRKSSRIALENASAGTTMSNLNKNIVNEFKVILPDIEKQRAFVKAIKISEQNIDLTNQLLSNSNTLFQSLLQQAFKGKLV